ncbi:N-acetylmuramidase domain-containing protein [uncultured Cohaesibacter sp.]|uniref:N-acetylmuramidase domain-containing protein n=1 Tax=uncultured Cohaesibacter sp. TaxID=1002546 RepID=UPI0029C79391|nr:N-acetylmuramidase domain-containing protein [uncultured Cohaesibacter sp.]
MSVVAQLRRGGGEVTDISTTIEAFASRIGCEVTVLRAILEVESGGDDYDDQGRLIILPEKHVFHRQLPKSLRKKALSLRLSASKWSRANYKGLGGKGSDQRWNLMERWARLDEEAALKSASYASFQGMGFNHRLCGYATVSEYVLSLAQSSTHCVEAFLSFLENSGLADELREKDWEGIARRYNGSGQVAYYSSLMRKAYARLGGSEDGRKSKPSSRLAMLRLGSSGYLVKALQERLCDLGYHVKVDSDFGPATRRAVVAFQVDHGLKTDGLVGPKTQAALEVAVPINRQLGNGRDGLTVSDLRKSGSDTVRKADWLTRLGGAVLGTGTLAGGLDGTDPGGLLDGLGQMTATLQSLRAQLSPIFSLIADNKWLAFGLVGLAIIFVAHQIKQRRLMDAQNWRHVG